ncbi:DUF1751-domain-containing protein [Auriculariales sp. MPI-PUGE-AT-0066]|nr:DUF1751-domain-containing protein [Auriculariales sp. MPI-PUGE-AT-0066]
MAILSTPLQYLTSIPLGTRVLAGLLVVFPVLHAYLERNLYTPAPILTLQPGVILYQPWTFLTAIFVETNPFSWLFGFISLVLSFRYLERLWGALEVAKFVLITGVLSNVIACVVNYLETLVLGNAELFLNGQQYFGTTAVQAGILVAFTQIIPEHQVQLFGVLRVRVKGLPTVYVTISTVLCLIGFQAPWIIIQFGWLISWVYLRFYKKSGTESGTETYGDRSETFAFVYWFPPFVHYPLGIVSSIVYDGAVRLHLIRPFSTSASDVEAGIAPGGARAEAERRRAMALKALDRQVQKANAASSSSSSQDGTPPPPAAASPATEDAKPVKSAEETEVKGKGKAPAAGDS